MKYIDFHCDTLLMYRKGNAAEGLYRNEHSVDFVRMQQGGCAAQFFATFMPPRTRMPESEDEPFRQALYDGLMNEIQAHADMIAFARNYEEYAANQAKGLMSAFLTFEDGRMVNGSHEQLEAYYQLGYRLISFTWNSANCFGYPNSSDPQEMQKGLTPFGFEAVEHMNQLGMIIDVSHLSDGGFFDVANTTKKPFVASHSNARSVCSAVRNLTDNMIRSLSNRGGITGINFCKDFLGTPDFGKDYIYQAVRQMKYLVKVGGEDFVGLGSDFDGIDPYSDFKDCTVMPRLADCMKKEGFSHTQIEKIFFKNVLRVYRELLP